MSSSPIYNEALQTIFRLPLLSQPPDDNIDTHKVIKIMNKNLIPFSVSTKGMFPLWRPKFDNESYDSLSLSLTLSL